MDGVGWVGCGKKQIMSIWRFKNRNFKIDYPLKKRSKKFFHGIAVSTTRKVSEVFQKTPIEKLQF